MENELQNFKKYLLEEIKKEEKTIFTYKNNINECKKYLISFQNQLDEIQTAKNEIGIPKKRKDLSQSIKNAKETIKNFENEIDMCDVGIEMYDRFIKCIDSKEDFLQREMEYKHLATNIALYLKNTKSKNKDLKDLIIKGKNPDLKHELQKNAFDILKYFVLKSKSNNANIRILECFNEDGSLNIDKYNQFKNFLLSIGQIKNFLLKYLFVSDEMLKDVEERKKQKAIEKKQKEEKSLQKFKNKSIETRQVVSSIPKKKEYTYIEKEIYSKYIDEYSGTLKKDVINKISLNDLLDKLGLLPGITRNKLDAYKSQYIQMGLDKLLNIFNKDSLKLLKNIIKSPESIEYSKIIELILGDNFYNLNNNQIKDSILPILNEFKNNSKKEEAKHNLVIFPYENFYSDEVNATIGLRLSEYQSTSNSLNQQITYLMTQNYEELSKTQDAFHVIKSESNLGVNTTTLISL